MKTLLTVSLALLLLTCAEAPTEAPAAIVTFSPDGYELTDLPDTDVQMAIRKDTTGRILEKGYLRNGKRNGAWLVYGDDFRFPKSLTNYTDDIANGVYMEFNERGDVTLQAFYQNNQLNGVRGEYKFGRPLLEAEYKDDQLNGYFREYNMRDGKMLKEVYYKNGVQDGPFRVFNEQEEMTLEYIYKDGERVSGGIIKTGNPNNPK